MGSEETEGRVLGLEFCIDGLPAAAATQAAEHSTRASPACRERAFDELTRVEWWRRRKSNPRPKRFVRKLLHAQKVGCDDGTIEPPSPSCLIFSIIENIFAA